MASEKARLAKDKGNAAFKAADYPTAIGHYTDAILADASDPTFFLNRAAAYLKLGKHEDAERDCTKVLGLSANNVKALFRRGQARRALGNLDGSRADLDKALALEPANVSVKNELLEIEKTLQQQRMKQRQKNVDSRPPAAGPVTPATVTTKRRRVPIEIVEDDSGPSRETQSSDVTKNEPLLQPVSSRPLKQDSKPATAGSPSPKPQTFMDAKQAREESKPVRVSGGIMRHTGNHTIVTRTSSEITPSARRQTSLPTSGKPTMSSSTEPPTTLFQFTKSWESLQTHFNKWNLIRTIPPSSIPALFQVSLDPELLRSILHTFRDTLEQDLTTETRDVVRDYLLAFTKVQRFGTVMLFMDKEERQLLDLLREKVNS